VYLGAFEEVIPAAGSPYNLVQRTDLSASVRHVRTRTTGGVITARFEYLHRDHLGSVDVVTSAAAAPGSVRAHRDGWPGHEAGPAAYALARPGRPVAKPEPDDVQCAALREPER
jgi:hypothetical protein